MLWNLTPLVWSLSFVFMLPSVHAIQFESLPQGLSWTNYTCFEFYNKQNHGNLSTSATTHDILVPIGRTWPVESWTSSQDKGMEKLKTINKSPLLQRETILRYCSQLSSSCTTTKIQLLLGWAEFKNMSRSYYTPKAKDKHTKLYILNKGNKAHFRTLILIILMGK